MFHSSRQVRERSLSRRVPNVVAEVGKKTLGQKFKKYGKDFLIGTGATMAFAYAFEKLSGSGSSKESSKPPPISAAPDSSNTANTANTATYANNQAYSTYPTSTNPAYSSSTDPTYSSSTNPAYATPTYSNPTNPAYSTSTYPTSQTQNGYQQRGVDRDLPADIFGEPHLESWFIDSIADGIVIISGPSEARSTSDNDNQNR